MSHRKTTTVTFHGAYLDKDKAKRKGRKVHGYLKRVKVQGRIRYMVITKTKGKKP